MQIESMRLKNFKLFQDVEIRDIPNFCVVVGANGSGKTTLFDVFSFLHDCLQLDFGQN
ncbi:MAG: AAA family ATPase [Gammaproteobacteria bacterium]|nr:AAA family ATPase [Gammaproteobacteria bacterium]